MLWRSFVEINGKCCPQPRSFAERTFLSNRTSLIGTTKSSRARWRSCRAFLGLIIALACVTGASTLRAEKSDAHSELLKCTAQDTVLFYPTKDYSGKTGKIPYQRVAQIYSPARELMELPLLEAGNPAILETTEELSVEVDNNLYLERDIRGELPALLQRPNPESQCWEDLASR